MIATRISAFRAASLPIFQLAEELPTLSKLPEEMNLCHRDSPELFFETP
jgi:hypothetical protein